MKFFLDTANIEEIRSVADSGLLDGVTTNPSLVSKETGTFQEMLKEICRIVPGPVSAEVVSTDTEGMLAEARVLAKIAPNIVVKIPTIPAGVKAVNILHGENIATNATLVFSSNQALLMAKAGATYVSPFIGRLDDAGAEGMDLIEEIVAIYSNYAFDTEIIVASIRHPGHVRDAAILGADIATMPYKVMKALFHHPLTDVGLAKFLEDWKKVPKD
ncbi:MAG: fructose-6-phosphate aldolase [Candidatus Eisenbacteria bacterium]|uniref:Probable transaldolase n=1 Tax=Eiseniibacteriota bacterium TaxID=2212470 RepID=A0A948RV59_UNCEI|nr:fructose-6-phosphate aldolase [Candidatus Eisenbacteria bacterium]MBU1947582.1 fructose-6-phosphate aldolase [Candidatus Eisenbacteria bacterium]MBU2690284.1 fructose-6-phosphate aldolase [Candidatus Eisenbacteria bacterium]